MQLAPGLCCHVRVCVYAYWSAECWKWVPSTKRLFYGARAEAPAWSSANVCKREELKRLQYYVARVNEAEQS